MTKRMVRQMTRAILHLQQISIQDEYGTPRDLYTKAKQDYSVYPLLDACSNHINKKCPLYFDIEKDALRQEWSFDFFMNPPYSKIQSFMSYAYSQHLKHNVNGLCLVYSKTDTRWWHQYVEGKAEVHFIKGRIKFEDEFGNPTKHPAPYPSCWVIWRKK